MNKWGLKFLTGFTKRERFLFIFTLSVILGLGFWFFILEPFYKKWSQFDIGLESANARLFKNLKLLANKDSIEKEYASYKEYIQKAKESEEEMASILKEIETLALSSGVKITSIKPKAKKAFKVYTKFNVELVGEASMNQFLKFMYDLENSKMLFKIERLVLSLKTGQGDVLKGTLIVRKISFN